MVYDSSFYAGLESMFATVTGESMMAGFSVVVGEESNPEEFKMPPVIEVVRAISGGALDSSTTERLTRFCILGKKITIKYQGKVLGSSFIMNGMEDIWDVFDVFKSCPTALCFLFEMCTAFVLKKSIPPQTVQTPVAAAGTASA